MVLSCGTVSRRVEGKPGVRGRGRELPEEGRRVKGGLFAGRACPVGDSGLQLSASSLGSCSLIRLLPDLKPLFNPS